MTQRGGNTHTHDRPCLVRTVEKDTEYRLGGTRIRDNLSERRREVATSNSWD